MYIWSLHQCYQNKVGSTRLTLTHACCLHYRILGHAIIAYKSINCDLINSTTGVKPLSSASVAQPQAELGFRTPKEPLLLGFCDIYDL